MITASFRALLLPRCVLAQSIIRVLMRGAMSRRRGELVRIARATHAQRALLDGLSSSHYPSNGVP
jgi:hypothetical protein